MILSGSKINEQLGKEIFIEPYSEKNLTTNSYNLTLNKKLLIYTDDILDMRKNNSVKEIIIPASGLVLKPGQLYLGATNEKTSTNKYIPILEGRSSIARLGLFVHITAGLGEAGFDGHWTLELTCVKPLKIYPDIKICQVYFNEIEGIPELCKSTKYQGSVEAIPSKLYQEF